MFWIIFEFARFRLAKTKRLRRLLCPYPTRIAFSNAVATDAARRHKSDACLRSPHRKQSVIYVGVPIGVGWIRLQRYKNILNYANENAKNVRNVCKKIWNLTERAIKDGSLTQKGGRKETYKNSRLCGREFLCLVIIWLKLSKSNRYSSSFEISPERCSFDPLKRESWRIARS